MAELLNLLFNPLSNGIMTVLTGLSLIYWVFSFLSGDGLDTDATFEMGDVSDADASVDSNADASFGSKVLEYINVGKVPVMVLVTLFKFIGWILTLASSIIFGLAEWGLRSVFILIPVGILSFVLLHFISKPLAKMYKNLGYNGEETIDFLGRTGVLKSTIENKKMGILEVVIQKDVFRLNVVSQSGKKLEYGSEVLIVKPLKNNVYEVQEIINLNTIN